MYHSSKVFGFGHVSALTMACDTKLASWSLTASCNTSPLPAPTPTPPNQQNQRFRAILFFVVVMTTWQHCVNFQLPTFVPLFYYKLYETSYLYILK